MGLAFQHPVYSGTEQLSLRDLRICVEIETGILGREIVVDVVPLNGTAESEDSITVMYS